MSYGVALRNGIPFTLGTIAALCVNATGQAWSPAALWPTGTEPTKEMARKVFAPSEPSKITEESRPPPLSPSGTMT